MTFEDLPSDIRTTPLTDPQLRADLIDLIVGEEDREFGSIAIWLCDEDLIGVQPMVCHQLGRATRAKTKRVLEVARDRAIHERLPPRIEAREPDLKRAGLGRVRGRMMRDDLAFANEVVELCESRGVLCLGVFVATPASVREVPEALRRVA